MKKTLLLLAMIASTASFAGNMVKLSADSSRDFSDKQLTVPTVFAAEVSMDKVAGTGLSFGGRLADKTDLYNLELTQNTVLDGKANFWAQYEGEVKGVKGLAKFSVDLDRENQGFGLFKADGTELKSTDTDLTGASYAAPYPKDDKKKITEYSKYKDVKDGKYKKNDPEKKGTIETSLSKEFMINDSVSLTGSFDTKSTFKFNKDSKFETVFTAGLDSKLKDGKLGLTLETDNNYKAPNGGFQYVSGKLSGGYSAFDAEAFVKYNFGKQTAVALNDDSTTTPAKTDRTDKKNELKFKDKLNELTDGKNFEDTDPYIVAGNKYANGKTYGDVYNKTLEKRIKDASKELKLSDSAFLEDYVQAHSKYEKSGFSVEGKLKFSHASSDVVEYKLNSAKNAIELNKDESHSMQEYMPELMLNLGYKASNGVSVELNNDLEYKATVKTGYIEEGTGKDHKLEPKPGDNATTTDHNLRYAVELKSGYTKDFASFAFETTNGLSAIINAGLHDKKQDGKKQNASEPNTEAATTPTVKPDGAVSAPAPAPAPVPAPTPAKVEKEFGFSSAVVSINSSNSLTAKVTDKLNVTPSLDATISVLLNNGKNIFEGVRGVATPKVAVKYMPLSGLTLGSYVSSDINAEFDAMKPIDDLEAFSSNYKQPKVNFGASLEYMW